MSKLKKQWLLATPFLFGTVVGVKASLLPILADEVEEVQTPVVEESKYTVIKQQDVEAPSLEGWNEDQSSYYINNEKVTGFQTIDNVQYYFNDEGVKQVGQKKIDNYWYVFDKDTGSMKTGLVYLNTDYTKEKYSKTSYYNNEGKMQYKEQKINGSWYVFDKYSGAMKTGLFLLDKDYTNANYTKTAYYNSQGKMQYKEQKINGSWYVFDKYSGAMKTGLVFLDKDYTNANYTKTTYYNQQGKMQYKQQKINGYWYCFDKFSGAMKTGITYLSTDYEKSGPKYVYYGNDGRMVHSNFVLNGKTYIVDRNSGAIKNYNPNYSKVFLEGIDISEHNGYIDLTPYKDGFVIIRTNWYTTADYMAIRNMELCEQLGIPYGVYCYSYALSNEEAAAEADKTLSMIAGRKISCGVWFDMEDADGYKAARNGLNANLISQMCQTYCSKIEAAGYYAGIYASSSWFGTYIKNVDQYDKWVANWGTNDGTLQSDLSSIGSLHQYTSIPLDKNVMYVNPNTYLV